MAGRSELLAHASAVVRSHASVCRFAIAAAALAALAVLHAAPAAVPRQQQSQQQPPAQQPGQQQQPIYRAEARLVRVDAYVNADGKAVDDLSANDFDVLEDGVRQKVETFEYVRKGQVVTPRAAGEPERPGRLFVLFVDTYHLPWVDRDRLEHREKEGPSWAPQPMRYPLVLPPPIPDDGMFRDSLKEIVNRLVGDEDRIAVLTPDMWAGSLAFMDRRGAIEELATRPLQAYIYGQRPPEVNHFEACFPPGPEIEEPMRSRYRLYRSFTTLHELMVNLELVREERKAVIAVTRGWDPPPRIMSYRDPRTNLIGVDYTVCHEERMAMADIDFDRWFHSIMDDARRSNVAFYSIYANMLVTYGRTGPDIDEDTRKYQRQWGDPGRPETAGMLYQGFPVILRERNLWHDVLGQLSKDTNGRAILKMDDFDSGLGDIRDSLASYYLLGYYSTNTKRDSAFRKISVTVRRKGVNVRARPGYRTVIPAEAALAARELPAPVAPEITSALAPLARLRADVPFHVAATPEWDAAASVWRVRIVGEIDSEQARQEAWRGGWRGQASLTSSDGKTVAGTAEVAVKAGQSAFSEIVPASGALPPGDYEARGKATGADPDVVFDARSPVTVPATGKVASGAALGQPLLSRRPNTPRSEFQPTADNRFNRREILRVEVPVIGAIEAATLRLVDRQGKGLGEPFPATVTERGGGAVIVGTIPLSNIAPGEYVIEVATSEKTPAATAHVAFRIVP